MKKTSQASVDSVIRPLAVTVKQAAAMMNCSEKTIRRLIDQGKLKACLKLRIILIPIQSIEKYLGII